MISISNLSARSASAAILLAIALGGASLPVLSQSAPTLEAFMGAEKYRAAGLDRLTGAEQAELVRWLQSKGVSAEPASDDAAPEVADAREPGDAGSRKTEADGRREPAIAGTRGVAPQVVPGESSRGDATGEDAIESRLQAPFTGWDGRTVFRLENGSIWRQRLPGRYSHREGDLPRVRITRNLMGFYEMELVAYDRTIGVSRER